MINLTKINMSLNVSELALSTPLIDNTSLHFSTDSARRDATGSMYRPSQTPPREPPGPGGPAMLPSDEIHDDASQDDNRSYTDVR